MRVENSINHLNIGLKIDNEESKNSNFSDVLKNFIEDVNNDLVQARLAEKKIESGKVDNINELLYTIEKSEISLRLITEIRNKALESYQEIMRMQV